MHKVGWECFKGLEVGKNHQRGKKQAQQANSSVLCFRNTLTAMYILRPLFLPSFPSSPIAFLSSHLPPFLSLVLQDYNVILSLYFYWSLGYATILGLI